MLYQVPSGSKSPSSGFAAGFAIRYSLRLAIIDQDPLAATFTIPLGTVDMPCEHPAPASSAYKVLPTNSTSETPSTSPPMISLAWLEGNWSVTVVLTPLTSIFEILPLVKLPV